MEQLSIHVKIEGRVQGVGFRAWTVSTANNLGLHGWVRNRVDGWVEAVFAGEEQAVEKMIEQCYEGPPAARVTRVEQHPFEEEVEEYFTHRPTV